MSAARGDLRVREVESTADPAWEGWLRIYHDSFPENERMTDGYLRDLLARRAAGEAPGAHLLSLAPAGDPERPLGIAFYEVDPEPEAAYLWYLATRAGDRGRGCGAGLYAEIARRCRAAGLRLLLFEVERPESEDATPYAQRRIDWYRRQGALLLGGVHYLQSVDRPIEPVEMHLMAHPFAALGAEEVFRVAEHVFGEAVRRTGPLTLT